MLHALPSPLPSGVVLPRANVLGSVTQRPMASSAIGDTMMLAGSEGSSAIYYTAADRAATLDAYTRALGAAGWKRIDLAREFPTRGGFAPSMPQVDMWCSPDQTTSVTVHSTHDDPAGIDVHVGQGAGTKMQCSEGGPFAMARAMMPKAVLPTFTAPSGITIGRAGPASDGSTTAASITSSIGLGPVFEAFASQLRAAGWTPADAAATAALKSQTFHKTVDGTAYTALLSVEALDATHYIALADVSSLAP